MFYVIHVKDENRWIWIKKKKEAVLAARLLSNVYNHISLKYSDGFGNYVNVPFGDGVQLGLFDPSFDDVFEKYIYHNGYSDFYAYKLKK